MVELGEHLRLALVACPRRRGKGARAGEHLHGDKPVESRITAAVDGAHPPASCEHEVCEIGNQRRGGQRMHPRDPLTKGPRGVPLVGPKLRERGQTPLGSELRHGLGAGGAIVEMPQKSRSFGLVNPLVEQVLPGLPVGAARDGETRLGHGAGSAWTESWSSRVTASRIIRCTFLRAT